MRIFYRIKILAVVFVITLLVEGCIKFGGKPQTAGIRSASASDGSQDADSQVEKNKMMLEAAEKFVRFSVSRSVLSRRADSGAKELSDLIDQISINCQMRLSLKLRGELLRAESERIPVIVDFWVERRGQSADDLSQLGSASLSLLYVPDSNAADRLVSGESDIERAVAEIHGKLRNMIRNVLRNSPLCAGEPESGK
jgi:hypothetical protein